MPTSAWGSSATAIKGDEYVVRIHDMSGDIQGLYGDLIRFVADGGGDTPESVNEALDAAVHDLDWSTRGRRSPDHLPRRRCATPHGLQERPQLPARDPARRAMQGIIVNTVQAGQDPETQGILAGHGTAGRQANTSRSRRTAARSTC